MNKIPEDDFILDILDISYSTARTLCSFHLDKKELYYDVISSLLSHLNFIDTMNTDLVLSESRYKRLRDFSKSARVGEMAQGINALFVAKRLNFPFIIDFDLARDKVHSITTNGKSPDFLVLDLTLQRLGLFESKGNMNGDINGNLRVALKQIDSVINPLCVNAKIPVCTQFQDNNNHSNKRLRKNKKSSINYCLIEEKCTSSLDKGLLRLLNYASWFYLVGDFKRVESILNDGNIAPIDENERFYELDTQTDASNHIYWIRNPLILNDLMASSKIGIDLFVSSTFYRHGNFKIGIYKKVIDAIVKPKESIEIFTIPSEEINYLRKYPDGTLLYLRNRKL